VYRQLTYIREEVIQVIEDNRINQLTGKSYEEVWDSLVFWELVTEKAIENGASPEDAGKGTWSADEDTPNYEKYWSPAIRHVTDHIIDANNANITAKLTPTHITDKHGHDYWHWIAVST
jgi:hypothetical protein